MSSSSIHRPTRVLVPLDSSPNAEYGVRHVVSEFLKNRNLEIHVLHVQQPFSRNISRFIGRKVRNEVHREQAETTLKRLRQVLDSSGVPYTVHTETGDKADCIANAAERLGCDRIVMGTARKSSLVRWLGDSVTNKVIQRTTVPVEVIAGNPASAMERVGIPAGVGAGLLGLWIAAE